MMAGMAPKRPPRVDLINDGPDGVLIGVLVCRAPDGDAAAMAVTALVIDAGWDQDDAVRAIDAAQVQHGRWRKTPDRHFAGGWLLLRADTARGATPATYYTWPRGGPYPWW